MPVFAPDGLLAEIRRRSVWEVIGVYLGAGWVAYQVVLSIAEGLGLPRWLPPMALALLVLGIPLVSATALLVSRGSTRPPDPAAAPPDSGTPGTDHDPQDAPALARNMPAIVKPSARGLWRGLAVAGVALLIIAAVLVIAALLMRPPLAVRVSNLRAISLDMGVEFQPALSPDGRDIAYLSGPITDPHLIIRSASSAITGGAVRVADPSLSNVRSPAWSSSGDVIRFRACRGTDCALEEIGRLAGAARAPALPARAATATQFAWSADGSQLAFVMGDTVFVASTADTSARPVAVHGNDFWALHSLAWSPDGKRIAYVNGNPEWLSSANVSSCSIWVVDVRAGTPWAVTTGSALNVSPAWLDTEHLLFVSNRDGPRAVYVVDVGRQHTRGEPRIVPGILDAHSISFAPAARKIAWSKFQVRQNIRSYPIDAATVSVAAGGYATNGNQVVETHDISSDGRWLAFDSNARGDMDLYRMPVGGGDAVPVTDLPGDEFEPRWSPDGSELAFYAGDSTCAATSGLEREAHAERGEHASSVMVIPSRGGVHRSLTCGRQFDNRGRWSPDGLSIAFHSNREGFPQIWLVRRDSVAGVWREEIRLTAYKALPLGWAPDGRGILGRSQDGAELYLVSPGGRVLWRYDLIDQHGLTLIGYTAYSHDGRYLYMIAKHLSGRSGIWVMPGGGGPVHLLVAFDDPHLVPQGYLSVGLDHVYLTVAEYESDIWVADVHY